MLVDFERAYLIICEWTHSKLVVVSHRELAAGKAGEFDGLSITMNHTYHVEERLHYLIHALGSIVGWSLRKEAVQSVFDALQRAKQEPLDSSQLETAISHYGDFEATSSRYAVWLLGEVGHSDIVPAYTNFMRADLEALTEFHRHGQTPIWRDFFSRWNRDVAAGLRTVQPFAPLAIPTFAPTRIQLQEILQQQPE